MHMRKINTNKIAVNWRRISISQIEPLECYVN